jgi:excisionase family DNA binding protein
MMTDLQVAIKAVQTYAESHPRPLHVTQKQAAEMLRLSVPTVRKMIACGALKLNKCGLIPINEVDRAMEAV